MKHQNLTKLMFKEKVISKYEQNADKVEAYERYSANLFQFRLFNAGI